MKSRQESIDTSALYKKNLAIPLSLQHSTNAIYSRKNLLCFNHMTFKELRIQKDLKTLPDHQFQRIIVKAILWLLRILREKFEIKTMIIILLLSKRILTLHYLIYKIIR